MLLRISFFVLGLVASKAFDTPYEALVSSSEFTEMGTYVNTNTKNTCEAEELGTLTTCANEVLSKLDECEPDDLACECCALQSLKRDCYGLCPNTASGNFLAVLYDDCETMNYINACNLHFKNPEGQESKMSVAEMEPDFVINSVLENTTTTETDPDHKLVHEHKVGLEESLKKDEYEELEVEDSPGSLLNFTDELNISNITLGNTTATQEANSAHVNAYGAVMVSFLAAFIALLFL